MSHPCEVLSRPPKPMFLPEQRRRSDALAIARRGVKRLLVHAIDNVWFAPARRRMHLVICGFPRSGSTLLQLMVETCFPRARSFHRERAALSVIDNTWPSPEGLLVSKLPDDIFWIDEIRDAYRWRKTQVRFVVTLRDPRAVLTSVHVSKPGYCVSVEKWRAVCEYVQYERRFPDVLRVEYRDVVERPLEVQRALCAFIGWEAARPFDQFHQVVPADFDTRPLNGVRALDPSAMSRWKDPQQRDRIRQILQEIPALPELLVDWGYEANTAWAAAYR